MDGYSSITTPKTGNAIPSLGRGAESADTTIWHLPSESSSGIGLVSGVAAMHDVHRPDIREKPLAAWRPGAFLYLERLTKPIDKS